MQSFEVTASNVMLSNKMVCHTNNYDPQLEHSATWHNPDTFVVPAAPDCCRNTGYLWGVWVDSKHRNKVWERLHDCNNSSQFTLHLLLSPVTE